ncbi:hypothetical protein [Neorhizobium sp. JUb45]|uniref:SecDF P1 head subdomain-containing protein n=1 Tax=unclassified Neorhizobium TaxID=2629175 RepID=UPI0010529892|nr:hypothetical protein [Neorhizobium sp. JUb45]TCR07190.1 hypothetical protein EDF70_1011160 [Neorhizobium sp. JUb45]
MKAILLASVLFVTSVLPLHAERLEVFSAEVKGDSQNGSHGVVVRFSPAAGQILERLTRENIGRTVHLELNGRAVLSPKVTAPITNRYIFLSDLSADLAERLASDIMKAGAIEMIVPGPAPAQQ